MVTDLKCCWHTAHYRLNAATYTVLHIVHRRDSRMSTHGLSIVRSRSTLGKTAAFSNAYIIYECISLGYFCLSSSFKVVSIEIKTKLVGSVLDVHTWPAALIDCQTEPSTEHYEPIVNDGTPFICCHSCQYPACAREILVMSQGYPEKWRMLTRSAA